MHRWTGVGAVLPFMGWVAVSSFILAACGEQGVPRPDVGFIPNAPPVATDDDATAMSGVLIAIDVLANDSDPDGDQLEVIEFTQANSGDVTRGDGRTLFYRAATDFQGNDMFTYTVTDGRGEQATGTVSIVVTVVNSAPVAVDDVFETQAGVALVLTPTANDIDGEGDMLEISDFDPPANGTVMQTGPEELMYTPNAGFRGIDRFTYAISDGGLFGFAEITVRVNGAPEAMDDDVSAAIGMVMEFDVTANDVDPDGDVLMVINVGQADNGTAEPGANAQSIRFTPPANFMGVAMFNYTVSDGRGGEDMATVRVTVSSAPVAVADTALTQQGVPVEIDVLANDMDPDNDPLTVRRIINMPMNGTATVTPTNRVLYTPNPAFSGVDQFMYEVDDGNFGRANGLITVQVNGAPRAVPDNVFTPVDTPTDINVLANDNDPEGDQLTVTMVQQPARGMAAVNPDGTIRYTPPNGFRGSERFNYTISDGNGGMASTRVDVTLNGLPVVLPDVAMTQQEMAVTIDVLANDTDPDNNMLMVSAVTPGSMGGQVVVSNNGADVTYTPGNGFFGTETFTYTANDGRMGEVVGLVTVTVNSRPVLVADMVATTQAMPITIDVLGNDMDPENDPLTITAVTPVGTGTVTINAGANITYTPVATFFGTENFMYTVMDNRGGMATAAVSVQVNGTLTAAPDMALTQRNMPIVIDVLANDSDPEMDPLTVAAAGPATSGMVTVANNMVTYTPNANFNGTDTFPYTLSDGNITTQGMVTVRVNAPPTAVLDNVTAQRNTPLVFDPRMNDTDLDMDTLTITNVTQPTDGMAMVQGGTMIRFVPTNGFAGVNQVLYTIEDGFGGMADGNVTIVVNAPPMTTADNFLVQEETATLLDVLVNDADPELSPLTVSAVTQGFGGLVEAAGANMDMVRFTPAMGFFGLDNFTYTAMDDAGGTAVGMIQVDVNARPIIANDEAIVMQDTLQVIDVLFNDNPVDGDPFNFANVTAGVNGGNVAVNPQQMIDYTPQLAYTGPDMFTYTVNDGRGAMGTANVNLTVVGRPAYGTTTDQLTGVADAFGVANADFNIDAFPDTAVTNRGQNTVTVVINTTLGANPTWAPRGEFAVGMGPEDVAAGDLNGDGLADLVVANADDNSVSVLLNMTPNQAIVPAFRAQVAFPAGTSPNSVTLGDFNRDNRLDIAVSNGAANTVAVLLNNTANAATVPVFRAAATFAANNARGIAAGDINRDNNPDIIAANENGNTVAVLLNTTAAAATVPTFGMATNVTVGNGPYQVAVGDLNQDNVVDLAVSNRNAGTVSILLNTTAVAAAAPTFAAVANLPVGVNPIGVLIADINQAGGLDIAVANSGSDNVSVLINNTLPAAMAPNFTAATNIAAGPSPWKLGTGDIDGDVNVMNDLLVLNSSAETITALLNGTAQGGAMPAFPNMGSARVGRSTPVDVEIADVTRDGALDAITLDQADGTITVIPNDTPAMAPFVRFGTPQTFDVGANGVDLAVVDINRDNRADVIVLNQAAQTVTLRLNTTGAPGMAATFGNAVTLNTGATPVALAVMDINRDNNNDILVVNQGVNNVGVYVNNTPAAGMTSAFAAPVTFGVGLTPNGIWVGDLNGDMNNDIAVAAGNLNAASVLRNMTAMGGVPMFENAVNTPVNGAVPRAIVGGDFNNDGLVDLATVNSQDGTMSILRSTTMNGAAMITFDMAQTLLPFPAGGTLQKIVTADVNNDNRLDFVVPSDGDDTLSVVVNLTPNNSNFFTVQQVGLQPGAFGPTSCAVGELNGDANIDVFVTTNEGDSLRAFAGP